MRQQPVVLVPQPKLQFNAHHELLPCDDKKKLAAKRHPIRHPVSTDQWGYMADVRASDLVRCVPQLSLKPRSRSQSGLDINCREPIASRRLGAAIDVTGVAELYPRTAYAFANSMRSCPLIGCGGQCDVIVNDHHSEGCRWPPGRCQPEECAQLRTNRAKPYSVSKEDEHQQAPRLADRRDEPCKRVCPIMILRCSSP